MSRDIVKQIYSRDKLVRFSIFLLGMLLISISYNVFILPNDIVYGVGGLGVIFYRTMKIDPSIIIMIGSILLLILSCFFLGWEKTRNSIIGSLLYPIFIKLTQPLSGYFDFGGTEAIVTVLCGSVVSGFGLGLVFKAGFTTGGTDILNQIVSKYFKVSIGKAMVFTDGIIVCFTLFIFGFQKFIYSIINMYVIGFMTDKVILGISQSKCFYIITEHESDVKKFILNNLSHGVTILDARGGYTGNVVKVIMCIIPTSEYFKVKEGIHTIDPNAFFLATDAYEVSGVK
jgi:uncharacterized membrane-anchored protein YitT (DUF2179 family)